MRGPRTGSGIQVVLALVAIAARLCLAVCPGYARRRSDHKAQSKRRRQCSVTHATSVPLPPVVIRRRLAAAAPSSSLPACGNGPGARARFSGGRGACLSQFVGDDVWLLATFARQRVGGKIHLTSMYFKRPCKHIPKGTLVSRLPPNVDHHYRHHCDLARRSRSVGHRLAAELPHMWKFGSTDRAAFVCQQLRPKSGPEMGCPRGHINKRRDLRYSALLTRSCSSFTSPAYQHGRGRIPRPSHWRSYWWGIEILCFVSHGRLWVVHSCSVSSGCPLAPCSPHFPGHIGCRLLRCPWKSHFRTGCWP